MTLAELISTLPLTVFPFINSAPADTPKTSPIKDPERFNPPLILYWACLSIFKFLLKPDVIAVAKSPVRALRTFLLPKASWSTCLEALLNPAKLPVFAAVSTAFLNASPAETLVPVLTTF